MFEKAIFRRSDQTPDSHINVGQIADILLYYREVDLLLDISNFGSLIQKIGPDALIRLAQLPFVNILLVTEDLLTLTNTNVFSNHRFVSASLADKKINGPFKSKKDRIRDLSYRALGRNWEAKRQADFLCQFTKEVSFSDGLAGPEIINAATGDMLNGDFLRRVAKITIEGKIPGFRLPENFKFKAIPQGDHVIIETDLDFIELNKRYATFWPPSHSSLTEASILGEVLESRASFGIAANLGGDVFTMDYATKIFELRTAQVNSRKELFLRETRDFSDWVLSGRKIGDTINNGEKSFHDFLDLVEDSIKFKNWIHQIGQDQKLAKEYFNEVNSTEWLDRVPAKVLRYSAFTGASTVISMFATPVVGAIVGASLAAADAFLLDRMVRGWKPNHFVEGRLKSF